MRTANRQQSGVRWQLSRSGAASAETVRAESPPVPLQWEKQRRLSPPSLHFLLPPGSAAPDPLSFHGPAVPAVPADRQPAPPRIVPGPFDRLPHLPPQAQPAAARYPRLPHSVPNPPEVLRPPHPHLHQIQKGRRCRKLWAIYIFSYSCS